MAERPITEAEARAECLRVGINPDDWGEVFGGRRIYAWQDVQRQMMSRDQLRPGANKET